MSLLEQLQALDGAGYSNDRGQARTLRLLPGLSPAELAGVSPHHPQVLREVLPFTRGIAGVEHVAEGIDLSGLALEGQALEEFSPNGVTLATDECGNSWTLDPPTGWIFYLCHDAPVVVYQFAHIGEFLDQLRCTPARSDLGENLSRWVSRIWTDNPGLLDWAQARAGDALLARFAEELGQQWEWVDLRNPRPGDGFSWGRHGPETEIRRHPEACLVALRKPKVRPSLWKRLWGG